MGDCSVNGVFSGIDANISDATFNNDVIMQNRLFVNTSDLSYNGISGTITTSSISGAYSLGTTYDGAFVRVVVGDGMAINKNDTHMVVGITGITNRGGIQIFERNGNDWVMRRELLLSETSNNHTYYGTSVAINEDATVIAVGHNGYNSGKGRAYIYTYDVNSPYTLTEAKVFEGVGYLGSSVAINSAGTMVVAGARSESKVYTYTYDGNNWSHISALDLTGTSGDYFGLRVALTPDNSYLAVAAFRHDIPANDAGCIKVYSYNSVDPSWNQIGSNILGDAGNDEFGHSVVINDDGTMIAAGAVGSNSSAGGYVKVYDRSGNDWSQRGFTISGGNTQLGFGYRISINSTGSIMAISGMGHQNTDVFNDGILNIYEAVDSSWNLINTFSVAASQFARGHAMTSTGDLIVAAHNGYESYGRLETYDISVNTLTLPMYASVNDVDTAGIFSTTDISLNDPLIVPGNITIVDNSANNYGAYITYAQKSGADYFNMGKSVANVFNIVNQNNIGIYMPTGSNSFTGTSDERLKKDIEPLENGTDKVMQLKPCSYKWKTQTDEDTEKHVGFIAQEVEEVLPEVVNENEYPDGSKYKGVSTTDMIPYLIKMNNELENRLKKLEN